MNESKFPKVFLTGDRPTGKLHLGHYVGSLQNRVKLQHECDETFYMVADVQALTDNADNPTKVRDNVREVVLDNLAVGLDPAKANIFIQSMVPEIAELTVFFMNLVTTAEVARNPTVKAEIKQKKFTTSKTQENINEEIKESPSYILYHALIKHINNKRPDSPITSELLADFHIPSDVTDQMFSLGMVPLGFFCYPVSQAADILFCKGTTVPVGEDQKPMVELTREIARSFNRIYGTEVFPEPQIVLSQTPRLIGTDGNAKMSKSLGNTIYLADSDETIDARVKSMFTCPSKIRVADTVTDEELAGNVVFQYLDIFDEDKVGVALLKKQYQSGEVGDVPVKARLAEVLKKIIGPIRARREDFASRPDEIDAILEKGILAARAKAKTTLAEVRRAMKIDYFPNL